MVTVWYAKYRLPDGHRVQKTSLERSRRFCRLQGNAAADLDRLPERRSGDIDVFSPEEIWALVRAADSEQDAAIFLTAAFTGLRMGELLALRWRDVDFARRPVRVRASYYLGQLTTPKSGRVRAVPMAPEVATARARLCRREHLTGEDDLVFVGAAGSHAGATCTTRHATRTRSWSLKRSASPSRPRPASRLRWLDPCPTCLAGPVVRGWLPAAVRVVADALGATMPSRYALGRLRRQPRLPSPRDQRTSAAQPAPPGVGPAPASLGEMNRGELLEHDQRDATLLQGQRGREARGRVAKKPRLFRRPGPEPGRGCRSRGAPPLLRGDLVALRLGSLLDRGDRDLRCRSEARLLCLAKRGAHVGVTRDPNQTHHRVGPTALIPFGDTWSNRLQKRWLGTSIGRRLAWK